ncbi:hypothetical protein [Nonomuraea recticatena]|uniref:hypothetical protein n=1 Tax=Nonomuraea recticatena TaxID=46178 RepID=UPI0031F74592
MSLVVLEQRGHDRRDITGRRLTGERRLRRPPVGGRAFGRWGERVADLAELPAALKRALDVNGPTVIEVTVDGSRSSATWEMAPPVASRRDPTSG